MYKNKCLECGRFYEFICGANKCDYIRIIFKKKPKIQLGL